MHQTVKMLLAGLSVAGLVAGCGQKSPTTSAKTSYVVGLSLGDLQEAGQIQIRDEIMKSVEGKNKFTLSVKDAQRDSQKQWGQLNELVQERAGLILVVPQDAAALTEAVAAVNKQGTPIIVIGRRVTGEDFTAFVGSSDSTLGLEAAGLGDAAFNLGRKILRGKSYNKEILVSPDAAAAHESTTEEDPAKE